MPPNNVREHNYALS